MRENGGGKGLGGWIRKGKIEMGPPVKAVRSIRLLATARIQAPDARAKRACGHAPPPEDAHSSSSIPRLYALSSPVLSIPHGGLVYHAPNTRKCSNTPDPSGPIEEIIESQKKLHSYRAPKRRMMILADRRDPFSMDPRTMYRPSSERDPFFFFLLFLFFSSVGQNSPLS